MCNVCEVQQANVNNKVTQELTEDMINEALALWKSGAPLQRRSGPNEWVNIARPSLSTLMAWMAQFKYLSIRAAPPEPRSLWAAEYRINGKLGYSGSYTSKAQCLSVWQTIPHFVRAVEFVEKMD